MDSRGVTATSGAVDEAPGPATAREVVRVLVVHHHHLLRRGLIATLEDDPRLCAVGEAAGLEAARRLQERLAPDVVLVDEPLWREREDEELPAARVLVLTASRRAAHLGRILTSGADGCVNPAGEPARLREAVHVVAAGGRYVADGVTDPVVRIDHDPDGGAPPDGAPYRLSPAELRVLGCLVRGLTNAQIADELHVSENTIKTQLSSIFRKLDVSHRAHASAVAIREGLVT